MISLGQVWTYPPSTAHIVMAKHHLANHGWTMPKRVSAESLRMVLLVAIYAHDIGSAPSFTLS